MSYKTEFILRDIIREQECVVQYLNYNPNALHYLRAHPDKIMLQHLAYNPNAEVVSMLQMYSSSTCPEFWHNVSASHNIAVLKWLIDSHPHKMDTEAFLNNSHDFAVWYVVSKLRYTRAELFQVATNIDLISKNCHVHHFIEDMIMEYALTHELSAKTLHNFARFAKTPKALAWLDLMHHKLDPNACVQNADAAIGRMGYEIACRGDNRKLIDKVLGHLCCNGAPWVEEFLVKNANKINWSALSKNPEHWALKLLRNNIAKIDWKLLHDNENPLVTNVLCEFPSHINAEAFCRRLGGIARLEFLRRNPEFIHASLWNSRDPLEMELVAKANVPHNGTSRQEMSENPSIFREVVRVHPIRNSAEIVNGGCQVAAFAEIASINAMRAANVSESSIALNVIPACLQNGFVDLAKKMFDDIVMPDMWRLVRDLKLMLDLCDDRQEMPDDPAFPTLVAIRAILESATQISDYAAKNLDVNTTWNVHTAAMAAATTADTMDVEADNDAGMHAEWAMFDIMDRMNQLHTITDLAELEAAQAELMALVAAQFDQYLSR